MKKTDALLRIVSLLVFMAMAAYLTINMVNRAMNPVRTALVVTATMSDSSALTGLVIREELVVKSDRQYIDVTVADGVKVGTGGTVAVVYGSEEALERANNLHLLSREIENVNAALSRAAGVKVAGDREETIIGAITQLSRSLRGGDLSGVESEENALAGLLFRTESGNTATMEHLRQLQAEYDALALTSAGEMERITVSQSGTFSAMVDGYEGVSPAYARELTPSRLRELIAADRVIDENAIGKLITSYDWYYAAIVPKEDAQNLTVGMDTKLSFGRYYGGYLDGSVDYVGAPEDGQQLVLFRMDKGMTDMLPVRSVAAELLYEEYTGLRVPVRSLYRYYAAYLADEDCGALRSGEPVTLTLGGVERETFVSEIGSATPYGELPEGVEPGSEEDTRPRRRLVVFCWNWSAEEPAPDFSSGGGIVALPEQGVTVHATNYYEYDPDVDRLSVFTMTGLQAERKIVQLVFAGEEYCLLTSEGDDALREGNEVIVETYNLYNGKVFE